MEIVTIDITKMTATELKAMMYDQLIDRDRAINNLNILQAELEKRLQPEKETVENENKIQP